MRRIRRGTDEQNPEHDMEIHCVIQRQSLYGQTLKFEHVTKVFSAVLFVLSHDSMIVIFNLFFRKLMPNMGAPFTLHKFVG
jgi:hypothetical protein